LSAMGLILCGPRDPRGGAPTDIQIVRNVSPRIAEIVAEAAKDAIAKKGAFSIAIAGGSLVKMLGAMVETPGVEWDKFWVAWVDERCVPYTDPESNYGGALEAWLSKVPIPKEQIFAINQDLCPGGGGMAVAAKAAEDYENRLSKIPKNALPQHPNGLPAFDLLLLGFGPDGHMCSLFPGHPLLEDTSGHWILPIADSPKPPAERITLSLGAVNAASRIVVAASGAAKADVVKKVFTPPCDLPIAKAWGRSPTGPTWVLDKSTALQITRVISTADEASKKALLLEAAATPEVTSTAPLFKEVADDVPKRVAELVAQAAREAIEEKGAFSIAIAGGSLVKMLGAMADASDVQWENWHVAWVDERCVPHSDKESNYGGALEAWLSKVPIPKDQIYAIDQSLCPGGGGMAVASKAADDYETRLKAVSEKAMPRHASGLPAFDLLLLGFGPDGHMCSLFPGHPLLVDKSDRWILPIADSPKPPAERITLSLQAVNAAQRIIVVGTGEAKSDIVNQVFAPPCGLPIAKAWGRSSKGPMWVLDKHAAQFLE